MNALGLYHGIPIPYTCVTAGFNWRSGQLCQNLADTYGTVHFRDRNLNLARDSILTKTKARMLRPGVPIPRRWADLAQALDISLVEVGSTFPATSFLTPEYIQSLAGVRFAIHQGNAMPQLARLSESGSSCGSSNSGNYGDWSDVSEESDDNC
jgi:hypothetical protein